MKEETDGLQKYYAQNNNECNRSRYIEINTPIDAEWKKAIVNKHLNGSIEVVNVLPPRIDRR